MDNHALSALSRLAIIDPALVVEMILKGGALLLVAGVVAGRLRAAAQRHLVWCLGLSAQLVLPLLAVLGPAWSVPMPSRFGALQSVVAPAATQGNLPSRVSSSDADLLAGSVSRSAPSAPEATASPREAARGSAGRAGWIVILVGWTAGSLLLLLSLLRARQRRERMLRHADSATSDRWQKLLTESADRLGLARLPQLLIGPRDAMPMTWGTLRPVLLMPGCATDWSNDCILDVLLHELAHVQRRDHLSQTMAQLVRALSWPNPLVWWSARRLRAESEQACDDLVVGAGVRPSRYAAHLLAIGRMHCATRTAAGLAAAGIGTAGRSQLTARITSILDETSTRTPLDRRRLLIGALTTAIIVFPLAAAVPSPTPPYPSPEPVLESAAAAPLIEEPAPSPSPELRSRPIESPEPEFPTQPTSRPEPAPSAGEPPALPDEPNSAAPDAVPLPAIAASAAAALPRILDPPAPSRYDAAPAASHQPPRFEAVPKSHFSRSFVLERGGLAVGELTLSRWKPRATLRVGETTYDLYREGRLSGEFVLSRGGSTLAHAVKPSALRRGYEIHAGGSTHYLRHPPLAGRHFVVTDAEGDLGAIEPTAWPSRRARIVLPEDWPLELQAFAFWLVELSWQKDDETLGVLLPTLVNPS